MISLKLNGYSREEAKTLIKLIDNSIISLTDSTCHLLHDDSTADCKKCDYRHLCNDLYSCLCYLQEKGDSIG